MQVKYLPFCAINMHVDLYIDFCFVYKSLTYQEQWSMNMPKTELIKSIFVLGTCIDFYNAPLMRTSFLLYIPFPVTEHGTKKNVSTFFLKIRGEGMSQTVADINMKKIHHHTDTFPLMGTFLSTKGQIADDFYVWYLQGMMIVLEAVNWWESFWKRHSADTYSEI